MAIMTVRSTYALDVETVRTLEELAQRWGVSKSEALRRTIRAAAQRRASPRSPLKALDRLQKSLALRPAVARTWARRVREERRAAPRR